MFNQSFNLTAELKNLPLNIRRKVMFNMVGSANAKVFNAADRISERLLSEYEIDIIKMLTQPELVALTSTVDDQDGLVTAKIIYGIAAEWRDTLQIDSDKDTEGTLAGTMTFMTGKQRMKTTSEVGAQKLAALGIKRTPAEKLATLRKDLEAANAAAQRKATRLGCTEFIIDRVIANNGGAFEELPEHDKEVFCSKYLEALDKARTNAIENEELGRDYGGNLMAADIMFIDAIKTAARALIYPDAPKVDTGLPGAGAVRVKASSPAKALLIADKAHAKAEDDFVKGYVMEAVEG